MNCIGYLEYKYIIIIVMVQIKIKKALYKYFRINGGGNI